MSCWCGAREASVLLCKRVKIGSNDTAQKKERLCTPAQAPTGTLRSLAWTLTAPEQLLSRSLSVPLSERRRADSA